MTQSTNQIKTGSKRSSVLINDQKERIMLEYVRRVDTFIIIMYVMKSNIYHITLTCMVLYDSDMHEYLLFLYKHGTYLSIFSQGNEEKG